MSIPFEMTDGRLRFDTTEPDLRRRMASGRTPIGLSDAPAWWKVMSPAKPGDCTVQDGAVANARSGPNLRTIDEFQDFRLEFEFNCPARSNSGVFLRPHYKLQIEEEPDNHDPLGQAGSIYGFLSSGPPISHRSGVWRKLCIALNGRAATVTLDGVTTLAGRGAIQFRNIVLIPGAQ